jgi:stage II sporulation protein AA (anti-sigma F factor antagonist)
MRLPPSLPRRPRDPLARWERHVTGLDVVLTHEGPLGVLRLSGEARQEVIHHLHEQAKKAMDGGARSLVLDCARLAFMDSASTGALIRLDKDLAAQGGRLVLCGVPRVIHRMLEAAGLAGRFQVAADEQAGRFLALGN